MDLFHGGYIDKMCILNVHFATRVLFVLVPVVHNPLLCFILPLLLKHWRDVARFSVKKKKCCVFCTQHMALYSSDWVIKALVRLPVCSQSTH